MVHTPLPGFTGYTETGTQRINVESHVQGMDSKTSVRSEWPHAYLIS